MHHKQSENTEFNFNAFGQSARVSEMSEKVPTFQEIPEELSPQHDVQD